jgi:2'-5' RNA ligase
VRLFFAVELPGDLRSALGRLQTGGDDYRWVDPALLHVTLAFLGEQPAEAVPVLEQVGARAATASHSSTLRLGEPGSFGPRNAPRVLWIGLAGDLPALLGLRSRLSNDLRAAGFALEDRPFRPHITLARRRESARGAIEWPPRTQTEAAAIPLRELVLFQSKLSPRGATYTPLATFPLST